MPCFSSAGVSSQVFNSDNSSSNTLLQSIKADQSVTFEIVKKIEAAINRYLSFQSFSKNFKLMFLDTSRYNQKEGGHEAFTTRLVRSAPLQYLYIVQV